VLLMNVVRTQHVRTSLLAEYLRQVRENGDTASYIFPSNATGCFQLASGEFNAMREGTVT